MKLRKLVNIQPDWEGEYQIHFFTNKLTLTWLHPRHWPIKWWFAFDRHKYDHGQTLWQFRVLGLEYHWSTYEK